MPELLLSSMPVQKTAKNVLANSIEEPAVSVTSNATIASDKSPKSEGKFSNILSSMVNQTGSENTGRLTESDIKELKVAMEGLLVELEKLAPDTELITEIKDFIDGQDFSTLSLDTADNGLNLPGLLSELDEKVDSIIKQFVNEAGMSSSENLNEQMTAVESAFLQLSTLISEMSNQAANQTSKQAPKQNGDTAQATNPALLGFSFDSVKGKEGQWQKYDPQQLSQPANTPMGSGTDQKTNNVSSPLNPSNNPQNSTFQSAETQGLVSEKNQNFKAGLEQLVSEKNKTFDVSDVVDSVSKTLVDDKAATTAVKFSDIQLRPANETLKQYSTTLSTPVSSAQWSEEVSQKILWFAGRNIQAAEMHLNPAELGPIDVKIHVQNDVANVTFNVHNASVRDLLESNVVRLREMMDANGVNVGDVNVDSGSSNQSQQSNSGSSGRGGGQSGDESEEHGELVMTEKEITLNETNLVDYFV